MPLKKPLTEQPPDMEENELLRVARVAWQLEQINTTLTDMSNRQLKSEERVEQRFNTIDTKLGQIPDKYVSKQEMEDRISPITDSIQHINENTTWLVRIIIAAVVLALLGVVLVSRGQIGM